MMKFWLVFIFACVLNADVMLLGEYKGDENLTGWVMSEKLDGVRAQWNGKNLISRSGNIFNPPSSWLENFPPFEMDGELYTKRGDFENIISIVADEKGSGEWEGVKFCIFDLPKNKGNLDEKLEILRKFLANGGSKNIQIIEQIPIKNKAHLDKFLDEIVRNGGEGVVLRDPKAEYQNGRSNKILKYKKFKDSECKVLAQNPGKGRFKGLMGSVTCEDIYSGARFKIGSGFSLKDRENPPKIGNIITYKYQSLSKYKKPKFASYLRKKRKI